MSDKLKPCPFCGGKAKLKETEYLGIFICCSKCGAKTSYRLSSSLVAKIWNNRVLPPFTPDELKEIRLMFDIGVRKLPDSRWVEIWQSIVDKCDAVLKGTGNE